MACYELAHMHVYASRARPPKKTRERAHARKVVYDRRVAWRGHVASAVARIPVHLAALNISTLRAASTRGFFARSSYSCSPHENEYEETRRNVETALHTVPP